ncbi:MAG: molecular chaperone [Rhodanobacteraceae bacterium]
MFASASSLVLSPLRLSLKAAQPISALTVRNDGDEAVVIQLELAAWTQAGGKDVYTATTDILASPPIFSVPAHQSQLVRVGLRRGADPGIELSYRVFLQEVPPPPAAGFKGLRVAARFGVPIFVAPAATEASPASAVPSALQWHVIRADGHLVLRASNPASLHERVTALTLSVAGTPEPLLHVQGTDYVLPGQSRDWIVHADRTPAPGTSLHILAATDAGSSEADGVLPGP